MGFHISWLAVRGKSPETVRSELALTETVDHGPLPESDVDAVLLSSGWYLVHFNDPQPQELSETMLERLSLQADVVTCVAEEGAMVSSASHFSNGVKKWAVVHDSDQGLEHLDIEGVLPNQFFTIRDRLLAQLKADPNPCDYIFDVPTELAQSITGFKHDQVRDDEESNPFAVLAREVAAKALTPPAYVREPLPKPVKPTRRRYKVIALGATCVCLITFSLIYALGRSSSNGNVWGPGGAPPILMPLFVTSVIVAFWAYVKSKK